MNPPGLNSGAATLSGLLNDGPRIWLAVGAAGAEETAAVETEGTGRAPKTKGLANGLSDRLEVSRSHRILWLLEELKIPYELKTWKRGPDRRADPKLKDIHPLGKSPVVTIERKDD